MRLALLSKKINPQTIIVIEQPSELPLLIDTAKEMNIKPLIGVRIKITAQSAGRWKQSSGYRAKFGLTTGELLEAIEILNGADLLGQLQLLHFHVGSQVPELQVFNDAVT